MIFAVTDWNPLIIATAASIPALVGLGAAYITLKHKLAEMQMTGLKTLHHVNSGTVFSARALEAATRALVEVNPSEENLAKHKAAILDVARAIATQNETADLVRSMGAKDIPAVIIPDTPIEVVLTTTEVKGTTDQLATKQDVKDALGNK